MAIIEIIIILILFASIVFYIKSYLDRTEVKAIKKDYKIPEGDIKYTDLDKPAKALFSATDKLVGKPDYIVERKEGHIPVEVKSTIANFPYKGHIMQLAAYCLLVEEKYKTNVPYGIIVYGNRQFKIPNTKALRSSLIKTIDEIRNSLRMNTATRNHNSINKCANCSFRRDCKDFVLG